MRKKQLNNNVGDLLCAAAHMIMRGVVFYGCTAVGYARGFTPRAEEAAYIVTTGASPAARCLWHFRPEAAAYLAETGHTIYTASSIARQFARVQWLLNESANMAGLVLMGLQNEAA